MVAIRTFVARTMLVALGAVPLVAVNPTTASAATPRNGVCESGEFCYYWATGRSGSLSDFTVSVANYGTTQPSCYDFKSSGAGQYECIKNNAVSAWNRSSVTVRVYYNSNYGGAYDAFPPGVTRNLNSSLMFENASHKFL